METSGGALVALLKKIPFSPTAEQGRATSHLQGLGDVGSGWGLSLKGEFKCRGTPEDRALAGQRKGFAGRGG